jgi:hypothetical protein
MSPAVLNFLYIIAQTAEQIEQFTHQYFVHVSLPVGSLRDRNNKFNSLLFSAIICHLSSRGKHVFCSPFEALDM